MIKNNSFLEIIGEERENLGDLSQINEEETTDDVENFDGPGWYIVSESEDKIIDGPFDDAEETLLAKESDHNDKSDYKAVQLNASANVVRSF